MLLPRAVATIFLFRAICGSDSNKACLTPTEDEITLLLLRHFHSSFCIRVVSDAARRFWPACNLIDHDRYYLWVSTLDQVEEFMNYESLGEKRSGKSTVVLRAEEENLARLRQMSQKTNLSSFVWIMYSEKPLEKKDFEGIRIPFNCEFIYVNARDNTYLMTEIYRVKDTSGIETSNFGYWTRNGGLFIHEQLLYRRRKTLRGEIFSAVIGNAPPYVMSIEKIPGKSEKQYNGYLYEVWREIQDRIDFRLDLSEQLYEMKSNALETDNVDFAVLPVAYDHSTLDHMDITHPIYESRSYLFGHRPGSELEWDSYLKPFDTNTWWASLGWMVTSATSLALFYRIAWWCGTAETESQYFVFTFSESLATVFRAMCMQGSDVTPKSSSCRLLFLSIYLTAFVVSSAFSAALFSLLTIPTPRPPFNDFQDVLNNAAYRMGLLPDSEIHDVLRDYVTRFPDSIQNKLLQRVDGKDSDHPTTLVDGLYRVCRNRMYVMMSDLPYVLFAMQNLTRDCQEKVMPAGPALLNRFIGFGLKKGSPYKEIIDLHLVAMRNDGIMQRLLLNNWPPQIPSVQVSWVRVTLADISPILYMFGLGAVLAVALLVAEKGQFLLSRKAKRSREKSATRKSRLWSEVVNRLSGETLKQIQGRMDDPRAGSPSIRIRSFWQ